MRVSIFGISRFCDRNLVPQVRDDIVSRRFRDDVVVLGVCESHNADTITPLITVSTLGVSRHCVYSPRA
ncbi:hypothetical protein SUGI_1018330 [Cryptomeria japonica]|nr:hypothetical protein SUGI_1018330 [Cryptomeria japonica]